MSNKQSEDFKYDTSETCKMKIKQMRETLKKHKMVNISYRIDNLKQMLKVWDKYRNEINRANLADLGQSTFTSDLLTFYTVREEIQQCISNVSSWAKARSCDTPLSLGLASSYVKPEPFGLCLIFSAWNCNFLTLLIPLAQAIAAGNLVIAKPAATAPETCKVCCKILQELNPDVVQVCAGKPEVYTELLNNRFDLLIFTGSAEKGKIIASAAAKYLTPTILELGGQNPVIVDDSADLKVAATNIVFGRHMIYGQACIAPEYIICDKKIKDKLVEEIKKTFTQFYGENPIKSESLGRIINDFHTNRIINLIQSPGEAKVIYGGTFNKEAKWIDPTFFVFESIEAMGKSNLSKDEIFGPVLYLAPYDTIEEAVNYINEREKPLAEYLFTTNSTIKEYVRENTSSGVLCINDTVVHFTSPYLPFGGVGNSGMGAYHGKWGFEHMSHLKPVVEQSNILIPFRYPPYTANSKRLLDLLLMKFNYGQDKIKKAILISFILVVFLIILSKYRS